MVVAPCMDRDLIEAWIAELRRFRSDVRAMAESTN